jgi:hypothetical protein
MTDVVGLLASIINILEGIKELRAFVKQAIRRRNLDTGAFHFHLWT